MRAFWVVIRSNRLQAPAGSLEVPSTRIVSIYLSTRIVSIYLAFRDKIVFRFVQQAKKPHQ